MQGVLGEAIARVARHEVEVRAAGRTDSGVHAEAQVAAFDTTRVQIEPQGWLLGVNKQLPHDVAIRAAARCAAGYTPRFDAIDKTYRYLVLAGDARHPLWHRRAWFVPDPLDIDAMRDAAARFVGTHDFGAFRSANDGRPTTVRTIHTLAITTEHSGEPGLFAIEVRGSAFLKQMVRIIVGTLVDVGRGRRTVASTDALLVPGTRRELSGPTAPAHGLTLMHVTLGRASLPADR